MPDSRFENLPIAELRLGMYVHLDIGWMHHPFACNHFKIVSHGQLDAIRQLGLTHIRIDRRTTSDDEPALSTATSAPESIWPIEIAPVRALTPPASYPKARLERLFGEATIACKHILEQAEEAPEAARKAAEELIRPLAKAILAQNENILHLLPMGFGERGAAHALNVTFLALLLARTCNIPEELMVDVGLGALLHDLGKQELPDRIRWLDDSFGTPEIMAYRQHVALGVSTGRRMQLPASALLILAQHHEYSDGSGYPMGLSGERIALPARIVGLTNQFDHLCNPLSPSAALTPHEALSTLYARMRSKFDNSVLNHFIHMLGIYPPGTVVELSDARHALVVGANAQSRSRPQIIVHDARTPAAEAPLIDLEQQPAIAIRRALKPAQLPKPVLDYLSPPARICYFFDPEAAATPIDTRR